MTAAESQRGFAHIVLIVVAVVIVGAVGYVAWNAFAKKTAENAATGVITAAIKSECEKKNDQDICKFVTSWKASDKYRMTTKDSAGATSVFEIDGTKSHMKTSGEQAYEIITIDKTTYTKAGDVWYKQTLTEPKNDTTTKKPEFSDPADNSDTSKSQEDKTVYKLLGKEACGNLTCFHYQVIDPTNKDSKEFIWFDDKDYRLRKTMSETSEGQTTVTFDYDNVTVAVPSPVKELAPNQYIMPGSTQPVTMPAAGDMPQ